jgi:predicted RNA-binding protein YlxR (DUF448 family)
METLRTCIACRHKDERGAKLRFVRAPDGEICFDEKALLPSRGAWVCASVACIKKAFQKRMLFKNERTLPVSEKDMLNNICERVKKSVLNRLGLLRRLGQCEVGRDVTKRLMLENKLEAVFLARDLAPRSVQEMTVLKTSVPVIASSLLMEEIGNCLGRTKTGVVGLLKSRITQELLSQINMLSKLGQ